MLKSLPEYEELARAAHGHLCAGQVLGIRMALHGLTLLGLDDPLGIHRKRLITFVEIDRCATDAIQVVTGCRLGKRALKFLDYGKMAATFCDLETGKSVRISALESSKERAARMFPHLEKPALQQLEGYRVLPPEELFAVRWVEVRLLPQDLPGFRGEPVFCQCCGERVNFGREVARDGRILCRSCAGDSYYDPLPHH
ncbi:MAG: FmdE family protein [Bryobacteraceae bacterium]